MSISSRQPRKARYGAAVAVSVAVLAGSYTLAAAARSQGSDRLSPAPTVLPQPPSRPSVDLSLEGHPQADFYENDLRGQQVRAWYETGWRPVPLDSGAAEFGFVPTEFFVGEG